MVDWQKHPPQPGGGYPPPPGPGGAWGPGGPAPGGSPPYGGYPPYGTYPPGYAPPFPPKPPDNLGWAIAAIFLFWPLAIPAFLAASKVDDLWARGQFELAGKNSQDARRYGLLALWIGVGLVILAVLLLVLLLVALARTTASVAPTVR